MSEGTIIMKRADELRPGDVFSTNGGRVESVVLCQDVLGKYDDEVAICWSFEADGDLPAEQRFEYVAPDKQVPVLVGSDARI